MYNLRLLDQHRQRVAIIDQYVSWQYTRRLSPDGSITVSLPRSAVDASMPEGQDVYAVLSPYQIVLQQSQTTVTQEPPHTQAQVAHFVEIYRDTDHVVTGRISTRNIGDDVVTITCHTEEIVLESHTAPAQYSRVYDGWDLADVARHQLHGWHTLRCKDQTQWADAIEAVNVNMTTEPGAVMLTKSGGRYVADGHVTVRFNRADVPNFVSWDRIRWASDNGDPVRTTMQYRYDGGPWSDEVEGALTDEIGIVLGTADADSIDVRINLYTDDRDTEDGEGNPVGQSPWVFAVELIARTEGQVTAGDIPASAGVTVRGLDVDGSNSLAILSAACEQAGWEFTVEQGRLSIAKELGDDRSHEVLLRTGTNLNVETLTDGDDELVNILTAYGPGQGINRLQVTRVHEASVQRYGPYPHKQEFDDVSTLADLIQAADEYLEQHALITPAFVVQPVHPYDADDVPKYGRGDYVRVADPTNGIITTSRIVEERRQGSVQGERVTLYLGLPPASLGDAIRPRPDKPPAEDATPPHVTVTPIEGGLRIVDTSTPSAGWTATECHVSTESNFEPSSVTLAQRDRLSRFTITGLEPVRHYVRLVRIVDGKPGPWSEERSATPRAPYEPDMTPPDAPVLGALDAQSIDLGSGRYDISVTIPYEVDERARRVIFERRELIDTDPDDWGDWEQVGQAATPPEEAEWTDRGALKDEGTYQYRARSESSEGVESSLSNTRQITIPQATVRPPAPENVTADFSTADFVLTWDAAPGATEYRVQVLDGDGVRRERKVTSNSYTYTLTANKEDGDPEPYLVGRVWSINKFGNESADYGQDDNVNPLPSEPTVSVESSLTQLRWRITSGVPDTFHSARVECGEYDEMLMSTFGTIDLSEAGVDDSEQAQVFVTVIDAFGRESDTHVAQTEGRYLSQKDMAGEIFQLKGRIYDDEGNDITPNAGTVEDLWDGNLNSVVEIIEPPGSETTYIEMIYPTDTLFEMMSVYVTGMIPSTEIRAEVFRRDGTWAPATEWVTPEDGDWTHVRFLNNRMYATRNVRLAVRDGQRGSIILSQLKFTTSLVADRIYGGTLRLSGDMAIENEEGDLRVDSRGIIISSSDGETALGIGGLAFRDADGRTSGYVRGVQAGMATDEEFVELPFSNDPFVILQPLSVTTYDPAEGGLQKLKLGVTDASPEGFTVNAKLVKHQGEDTRHEFPRDTKYDPDTGGAAGYCFGESGHDPDDGEEYSSRALISVNDSSTYTTAPGTTAITVAVREMMHVHAFAGQFSGRNTITYRIRIRPKGSESWTHTLGPYTRSISQTSSIFVGASNKHHKQKTYSIENLAPDEYDVQIEVTDKSVRSGQGQNSNRSCFVIWEEISWSNEEAIDTPEPAMVQYLALETDSASDEN